MRGSGEVNDIELGSSKMSPLNHAQPALPTTCLLISVIGFSKQMQIDLMICISRSFLSLISSSILGSGFFLWEVGRVSRAKIINISNVTVY